MMMQSCKTCRYLAVPRDIKGRVVVRALHTYQCQIIVPMPALPDSITLSHSFRGPIGRRWMSGSDGTTCPTWEERVKP
jgi:hypothetical protein